MKQLTVALILIGILGLTACSPGTTTIINNTTIIPTSNIQTPVSTMQNSDNVARANAEVAEVLTADQAYMADHGGIIASNSNQLLPYFTQAPDATYAFDSNGRIINVINGTGYTKGLQWDSATQKWI